MDLYFPTCCLAPFFSCCFYVIFPVFCTLTLLSSEITKGANPLRKPMVRTRDVSIRSSSSNPSPYMKLAISHHFAHTRFGCEDTATNPLGQQSNYYFASSYFSFRSSFICSLLILCGHAIKRLYPEYNEEGKAVSAYSPSPPPFYLPRGVYLLRGDYLA